tara:strand:- start:3999 stop:4391 length:393 start_codon:yes stop_codon:yes gene_type:complete
MSSSDNSSANDNNNTITTKEELALKAFNLIKTNLFTASENYLIKIKDLCNEWAAENIEIINKNLAVNQANAVKYRIIKFSINVVKVVTDGQQQKFDNLIKLEENHRELLQAGRALKKIKEGNKLKSQMKY